MVGPNFRYGLVGFCGSGRVYGSILLGGRGGVQGCSEPLVSLHIPQGPRSSEVEDRVLWFLP